MRKAVKGNIALFLIALVIMLILSEFFFRKINFPKELEVIPTGWTYLSNNPDANEVNQYGFKGKPIPDIKPKSEKWILLLGDSQVESLDLADSLQMENLLQRVLNFNSDSTTYRIFTVGTGGYGQDQQLIWFQKVLEKHEMDHVFLWFTPENDIWNNMFPTHWPWNGTPKPTFILRQDKLVLELSDIEFRQTRELKIAALFERAIQHRKAQKLDDVWSKNFLPPRAEIGADTSLSKKTTPWVGISEKLKEEKTHLILYSDTMTKRLEYGIRLTRALLDSIQSVCVNHQASFNVFVSENQFYSDIEDGQWMYDKNLKRFIKLSKTKYDFRLVKILSGYSSKLFRLKTEKKNISPHDTYHLNEAAQRELADSLKGWIFSNAFLSSSSSVNRIPQ